MADRPAFTGASRKFTRSGGSRPVVGFTSDTGQDAEDLLAELVVTAGLVQDCELRVSGGGRGPLALWLVSGRRGRGGWGRERMILCLIEVSCAGSL